MWVFVSKVQPTANSCGVCLAVCSEPAALRRPGSRRASAGRKGAFYACLELSLFRAKSDLPCVHRARRCAAADAYFHAPPRAGGSLCIWLRAGRVAPKKRAAARALDMLQASAALSAKARTFSGSSARLQPLAWPAPPQQLRVGTIGCAGRGCGEKAAAACAPELRTETAHAQGTRRVRMTRPQKSARTRSQELKLTSWTRIDMVSRLRRQAHCQTPCAPRRRAFNRPCAAFRNFPVALRTARSSPRRAALRLRVF